MRLRTCAAWTAALASCSAFGQAYTCPDTPTWAAVPCSMHKAIQPQDAMPFVLTHVFERDDYLDYIVVADSSAARLRIYRHFEDPHWVAVRVAMAWAAQPRVLRRSAMPLMIGIDWAGPVYWDYIDTAEARHIVEYPAGYVHEADDTLDWAFEELLTHELCHVIDRKYDLRNREKWLAAADADKAYVTDYAAGSNGEDFAESCAAYVLTQLDSDRTKRRLTHEHRKRVMDTMPRRGRYFAGLFPRWNDLIPFH